MSNDNNIFNALQIMDLKHLAEIEHEWKRQCRLAILSYKKWRFGHRYQKDVFLRYYGALEGDLLRQHALNFVKTYWVIRQDCRRVFAEYRAEQCVFMPYDYKQSKQS